jgi:hypothetical protein
MQILIALMALWLPILAGYQMGRLENAQIEPGGWVETCELQRVDGEVVEVCTPQHYEVRASGLVTLPAQCTGAVRGLIELHEGEFPQLNRISFDIDGWRVGALQYVDRAGEILLFDRASFYCRVMVNGRQEELWGAAQSETITLVIPPYE